jgi:hypothetical protein
MRSYSLAVHGQPGNVRAAAESMLRLLRPMLGNRWRTEDATASDVVILDAASLDELNRAGAARADALYVVLEGAGVPPSNAFGTIRRPLNSSGLIEVLHMAQAELERRQGGRVEMPAVARGPGREAADRRGTDTSMRAAVRALLQDRSAAVSVLTAAQAHVLSVLPDVGFATRLDASEIAALVRSDAPVTVLALSEVQRTLLFRKQRKYYPLKKLEWIYWLAGSDGELRPELDAATPYRLSRWPDFSRLPHFRADVRMASLLKAEALAVRALSERAGVRLETAVNFVNACWSLGLLARSSAIEPALASMTDDAAASPGRDRRAAVAGGGLLGSLRSALGLAERRSRSA